MPLLSIVTAAYAPSASYISATIAGVALQEMTGGWDLEWIVQEDGDDPRLSAQFECLPLARYESNGRSLGIARTRNLALSRARGKLIQCLDHDDVLFPGALRPMVARFEGNDIAWAVGQADDLMPDGTRLPYESALPYGLVAAGAVNDWAIERGGNWPIHCAGLIMRTDLVRAVGGWAGLAVDDDVAMLAAISELADGYNEPMVTWLYRHHNQQTHKSASWRSRGAEGRAIAVQRVAAIRALSRRGAGFLVNASRCDEPRVAWAGTVHGGR